MMEQSRNRAKEDKQRRRAGLEKGLIVAVVLVSIIAVVFVVLHFTKNSHELQHGFGEYGRRVILNGKQVDWWSNATAEAFNKTKQCAIEEYESVPFTHKLNGRLALEENLADIVGIDVAYEAYNEWVKKYGEEKKLPGIPLTPKQIFWIQTGTSLCFRKLDDDSVDMNELGDHAIPSFRVTAGARNSRYFANDFNCPEGSFMKEKCRIL